MSKVSKVLLVVILLIIGSTASAFGMYKYTELRSFNNLVNQGKQYIIQKDYDKAIQVFQQALSYRNNTDIQNNLLLAQNLKNENSKKEVISKNIQLAGDAAKSNKYDEANKYLDEILKVDPNNSEAKSLKDSYAKAVQDQQEKAKLEQANMQSQQKNKNSSSEGGVTQQQAYSLVSSKFSDCDVFVPKRSDYSDEIAKQAGDRYYLFYTEYKLDHSASDYLVGVDKKTGVMYRISGHAPVKRIN